MSSSSPVYNHIHCLHVILRYKVTVVVSCCEGRHPPVECLRWRAPTHLQSLDALCVDPNNASSCSPLIYSASVGFWARQRGDAAELENTSDEKRRAACGVCHPPDMSPHQERPITVWLLHNPSRVPAMLACLCPSICVQFSPPPDISLVGRCSDMF